MTRTGEGFDITLPYDDVLEMAKIGFMEAYDDGENPTIDQWRRKYPLYAWELCEFILDYVRMENRMRRMPESERNAPSPHYAIDILEIVLGRIRRGEI